MATRTAIVAGSVAQRPGRGGHTWVFLQYLLGLRKLGWEVVLLDRLEPDMCVDSGGRPCAIQESRNLAYLEEVMRRFDLSGDWALLYDGGRHCLGIDREELLARVGRSAILINVNGFIEDTEVLERAPLRVFLDIDPGFLQMWCDLGLHDAFAGHDAFVTIGERIGQPGCTIPTCGLDWITTPQPVVLDQWPFCPPTGGRFTSVASWRGLFGPIEHGGVTYGLRVHEFRRFAELPTLTRESFEIALDIDEADAADVALLRDNGWSLADPGTAAADPWAYRSYVQGSMAELMIAKNMAVRSRGGWFSDRSICYLASGKPVLAQDTGFSEPYPVGEGLLCFSDVEEARSGAEEISLRYSHHALAARELAERFFDSSRVLARLLSELGVA